MDKIAVAKILDKFELNNRTGKMSVSSFMDPAVSAYLTKKLNLKTFQLCSQNLINEDRFLWGGFNEAERVVLVCGFKINNDVKADQFKFLSLLKINIDIPKISYRSNKKLGHRDFLGSILNLGISRDLIGDIIVFDDYAYAVIISSISDYILENLRKVSNFSVTIKKVQMDFIEKSNFTSETIRDTVPSVRLDNVLVSFIRISRAVARDIIKSGNVYVNWVRCEKPDYILKENDMITARDYGRVKLDKIGTLNNKGRLPIVMRIN
jgi:RNA-binding protein YlmH